MALNDQVIIIIIGLVFNYLVLYKRNKFFGGIVYMVISLITMGYSTDNTTASIGLIMLLASFVIFIYDMIGWFFGNKKQRDMT